MKKYIKVILAVLSAFLILLLCACDLDESSGNLQGGDLLDAGRISEIKDEVLATEETTAAETTSDENDDGESHSDEKANDTEQTENTEGTETQSNASTDTDSTGFDENVGDEVYWTESGGVWHLYRDCGHLKNSQNVLSGTVADAEEAGKDHVCSSCNKKAGKD